MRFILCSVCLPFLLSAAVQANPMPLEVLVAVKVTDRDTKSGSTPTKTESRSLAVKITNRSNTDYEGLTLNWTLFAARLQRGADITVPQERGTVQFGVAGGNAVYETETKGVNFTWTPKHSEKSGSGRRARFKKVDESGDRYNGYLVKVTDREGNVVGQAVSHPALLKEE
jgi:hypothetical protein